MLLEIGPRREKRVLQKTIAREISGFEFGERRVGRDRAARKRMSAGKIVAAGGHGSGPQWRRAGNNRPHFHDPRL